MKLNSKEKLIWGICSNTTFSSIPNKKKVWDRLIQQIHIHDQKLKSNQTPQKQIINKIKYRLISKPSYIYVIGTFLVTFFLISSFYKTYSTNIITTETSERKVLKLSDGTIITLHSGSEIIYNKNYNNTNRKIFLSGEAFFNVAKGNFPLIINTEHGQITVLGTVFNVRSRNDGFEIGVNEGIINISNANCTIQLTQGQLIQTTSSFKKTDIQNINYKNYPDWIDYKIYCNKTNLLDVCSEIERIFNVTFIFSQPLLEKTLLTGLINSSDLQTVLKTLSILTVHNFKLVGDTVTII